MEGGKAERREGGEERGERGERGGTCRERKDARMKVGWQGLRRGWGVRCACGSRCEDDLDDLLVGVAETSRQDVKSSWKAWRPSSRSTLARDGARHTEIV